MSSEELSSRSEPSVRRRLDDPEGASKERRRFREGRKYMESSEWGSRVGCSNDSEGRWRDEREEAGLREIVWITIHAISDVMLGKH